MTVIKKNGNKVASVKDVDAYFKEQEITDRSEYDIELSSAEKTTERNIELKNITITIDGAAGETFIFEADERSRNLMNQAINSAETLGLTQTNWKLSNDTWIPVSLATLKQVMAQGIQKHGEIMAQYD